ncbi:MAG: phytanoyl-CoA dioxygenase family protein [Nitratireductor sp.]
MTAIDRLSLAASRTSATWLTRDGAGLEAFVAETSRETDLGEWPHAAGCEKNILVYDGEAVAKARLDPDMMKSLTAEWAHALRSGPGVIVIKRAIADTAIVDRATGIFESLITAQQTAGTGGGDHFAKPGANDRVWNALQKHCEADPTNFAAYYASPTIALASLAWLGPNYQMTAQVNRVNPGGAAQSAHRDYHLGFMSTDEALRYPASCHEISPFMTLQGAIAHCDMPLESGPTLFLPYSQNFSHGYVLFETPQFQQHFNHHHVQLPLEKGDAVFFNPALMHAAGTNRSTNIYRMANLLQVSSAFGRAMETVDRIACARALYPALLDAAMSESETSDAIAACAEGYAFPTNLDRDPPIGGLAPKSQAAFMREAIANRMPPADFNATLDAMEAKRGA